MKHPETQLLIYVLLIMKLIDDGDLKNVSLKFSLSIMNRRKNLVTLSWLDAEVWTRGQWITSLRKQSTSSPSLTKRKRCWSNSGLPCSRRTKIAACNRTRLDKQQRWTSSLGAIFSKISTSRLATSSSKLSSLRVYQTINMLAIFTMSDASRQSNSNTLRLRQVWFRVKGRDQR